MHREVHVYNVIHIANLHIGKEIVYPPSPDNDLQYLAGTLEIQPQSHHRHDMVEMGFCCFCCYVKHKTYTFQLQYLSVHLSFYTGQSHAVQCFTFVR